MGRRPMLIFSLLGTVVSFVMLALAANLAVLFAARVVDGLSGGNITVARAYIADVTEPEGRARAYGLLGAAFGLGFVVGPALGGAFAHISYTAPIWAAAAITLAAVLLAFLWLPETVHRGEAMTASPWRALPEVLRRPRLRPLLLADFAYWCAFAMCHTTFPLFAARRFGFDVPQTGYVLSAFGCLGVLVQLGLVGGRETVRGEPDVRSGIGAVCLRMGSGGADRDADSLPRHARPCRSASDCAARR